MRSRSSYINETSMPTCPFKLYRGFGETHKISLPPRSGHDIFGWVGILFPELRPLGPCGTVPLIPIFRRKDK